VCSPAGSKRAKGLVADQVSYLEQTCRSRLRSVRQTAQTLHRQLRRKGADKEARQQRLYQKLVETAEHMVRQATRVVAALGQQTSKEAQRLRGEAEKVLPLVIQVIGQTRTRVLEGKKVPAGEKVLSLFEPHTRAIPRHKGGALVEFGRHVLLDEVEGGIVTRYQILEHPEEHGQAINAVAHHCAVFAQPPNLVAGDRGVHSANTEKRLLAMGVKRVAIPAEGKLSEERQVLERTRTFRRGYRWRAGIEGRIASLRRDYGWRKSAYHGQEGMERWIIYTDLVDARCAHRHVSELAPMLQEIKERWPSPGNHKVRLPAGCYVKPGFSQQYKLYDAIGGQLADHRRDAARALLTSQTPAAIVPVYPPDPEPDPRSTKRQPSSRETSSKKHQNQTRPALQSPDAR
jgi:IS5 family transposase